MKLIKVCIEGFRSIQSLELTDCGNFNVLIGKNNTGKSNILSAIQTFFSHVNGDSILSSSPKIGKDTDFYGKEKSPINITHTFFLSPSDWNVLIQDIIKEDTLAEEALRDSEAPLQMSVTLTIFPPVSSQGLVSKIALSSLNGTNQKYLLQVDAASQQELRSKQHFTDVLNNLSDILDSKEYSMNSSMGNVLRSQATNAAIRLIRSSLSQVHLPPNIIDNLAAYVKAENADYNTFIDYAQKLAKNLDKEPLQNKLSVLTGEGVVVPAYIINIMKKISETKVIYLSEHRKHVGEYEASKILSLKRRRKGQIYFQDIQKIVSKSLDVNIDAFESDTPNSSGKTIAEIDIDDFLVEVNGSGIRESLKLILDVAFEQPDILLIEEPETHLHPALETNMMQYLKNISTEKQVFITTHSTNFLDTADMKNMYLITKPTSTQAQLLNLEDAETQIPRELGMRLSSLFMYDTLVFVEGPSDEAMIRAWASKIGINLNQVNVGFIRIGGSRNIHHYALENTLSFLKRRQVRLYFLIDIDERSNEEIENLEKKANVHILKKREIENYLVAPRAIAKFIKWKQDAGGQRNDMEYSDAEIQKTLEECAEKLKQLTIDKRVTHLLCKSVHWKLEDDQSVPILEKIANKSRRIVNDLEEVERDMQRVYYEQAREVNLIWDSQKFGLVPGDELLDMVCKKYNVRFKKREGDGKLLAEQMNADEIAEEVQQFIRRIGSSDLSMQDN